MSPVAFGDDPPAWLKQAAAMSVPAYGKDVHAVILHDESRKTVDNDGKIVTVNWEAIRIISREGRGLATARESYNTGSGKIKEMRAWLIRPNGEIKSYGKKEIIDVADAENNVYDDTREKVISAKDDADAGCVFGYEIITEEREVFSQFVWYFQAFNPVVLSRITLVLPQGWRAESVPFNRDKIEPVVSGSTYTWEMRNLPAVEEEPASPGIGKLVASLAINIFPGEGKATMLRSFATWKDVSRYTSELSDPQTAFNEPMAAKARELAVNAKTEYERIQAIGRYAQNVNYISIQVGVGRGGGYRPHAAIDVFNKNYGDCKDKANLMRSMLKSLGIESYPVVIYSGDPNFVRPEWPSPHQFNHCIIAVKVSDETNAATIIKHSTLGRLLIFDPTDDDTPVGDLPHHEQGSYALIVAGNAGELMKMPVTSPEANRLERKIEGELAADGSLTATVHERSFGQAAVTERRGFKGLARPQFNKLIERWITTTAPSASVSKIDPADNARDGQFALDVEFKSPSYAQSMRGKLLVFKPAIVSRRSSLFLTSPTRKHPVVLSAKAYSETVTIKLPAGFDVDEMPDAAELNQPFGNYTASYEVKDGSLIFKRSLVIKAATIPVEQYAAVRTFFERIRATEQSPVVLAKK
ncbi:MAG: DUF3857 domain-containing protein [Acidobacteriota bacterium]